MVLVPNAISSLLPKGLRRLDNKAQISATMPIFVSGTRTAYSPITKLAIEDHFVGKGMFMKRIYRDDFPQAERKVLLLMPGNWSNGNFFRASLGSGDFKVPDHTDSYANFMAASGYDVFIYHGFNPRVWSRYVERKLFRKCPVPIKDISFEKTLELDLPKVLDHLVETTGDSRICCLGHSKAGLLLLAHAGITKDPRVKAIQTVATPVTFTGEQRGIKLGALISLLYFTVGLKEFNPIQLTSASVIQLTKLLPKDHRLLEHLPLAWNPENIRTRQLIFMRDKVSEPLSLAEFWFFVQMILTGEFKSLPEGNYNELSLVRLMVDLLERRDLFAALKFSHEPRSQVDYGRALINITAPVAVFVGEKDQIAPPATSLPILEMVGSKTREAFIDPEAGHVDVWVGKRSMVSWEKSLAFFNAQY